MNDYEPMTSHTYEFHKDRVKKVDKTERKKLIDNIQSPHFNNHVSNASHFAGDITPLVTSHSLARKAIREEKYKGIGVSDEYQKKQAAVLEPFYRDPRNLAISNLVRGFTIPLKNRKTLINNLMISTGIGAISWYFGKLDNYLMIQSAYALFDLILETLPLSSNLRNVGVGGGLEDYFLRTRHQ